MPFGQRFGYLACALAVERLMPTILAYLFSTVNERESHYYWLYMVAHCCFIEKVFWEFFPQMTEKFLGIAHVDLLKAVKFSLGRLYPQCRPSFRGHRTISNFNLADQLQKLRMDTLILVVIVRIRQSLGYQE
jgi:hypothetical protein